MLASPIREGWHGCDSDCTDGFDACLTAGCGPARLGQQAGAAHFGYCHGALDGYSREAPAQACGIGSANPTQLGPSLKRGGA
jgi:hypothetical protein